MRFEIHWKKSVATILPITICSIQILARVFVEDFFTKFREVHFCWARDWKSSWEPTNRKEKKRRTYRKDGRFVRTYRRLSRMHDQFPARKDGRCASLTLVKYASDIIALSIPYNEALLMRRVATGPLQLV